MKEEKVQAFVDVVENYFGQFSDEELVIDTPYLFEGGQPSLYGYTGVIGISGVMKGLVYVSASKELLQVVLQDMREDDISDLMLQDLVGEIANTIAGNARKDFGSEFHISTPFVIQGELQSVALPKSERLFIIPILWKQEKGEIGVALEY